MATKTRKTPTTRGKRSGTKARGQGSAKTLLKNMTASRKAGAGNTMGNNASITAKTIANYQQWLRFGQKNDLLHRFFGSPNYQTELTKYQQNQPASLTAGGKRT